MRRRRTTKHEKELGAGSQRQWHRRQKELILGAEPSQVTQVEHLLALRA